MLDGILLLWFVLTGLSLLYVTYDLIFVTPEAKVMKVGWWFVILYTGPIGLFFYFLTCKEPMPGTHEKFIEPLWKQALGSEVHCLAGDVTGIIAAAFVLTFFTISLSTELLFEYMAGFFFGWLIFQSLFMKSMMGGSYGKALKASFFPEWLSMNTIMAGMIPAMVIWDTFNPNARNPETLHFWGMMSLATIVGGITAYPMNRWLVKNGIKHGMMTIREGKMSKMAHRPNVVTSTKLFVMTLISLVALTAGIAIAVLVRAS